jgi:hypothetical protein
MSSAAKASGGPSRAHSIAKATGDIAAIVDAQLAKREKGKAKPQEKKAWWETALDVGGKVVGTLAKIVPAVLPFLVSVQGHQPTLQALRRAPPSVQLAAGVPQGMPIAIPMGLKQQAGIKNLKVGHGKTGINRLTIQGMDYLTSVQTAGTQAAGDILLDVPLNPTNGILASTRLAYFARAWEKYRVKSATILYEPTAPTTQQGALVMYLDNDPADSAGGVGQSALQRAGAHEGSQPFNVWSMGMCWLPIDNQMTDLFVDSVGTDIRFIDFARLVIMCESAFSGSVLNCGNLYIVYEIEFTVPSLDPFAASAGGVFELSVASVTGGTVGNIWGTQDPYASKNLNSTLDLSTAMPGTFWVFYNLPIGSYWLETDATVTSVAGTTQLLLQANGPGTSLAVSASGTTSTTLSFWFGVYNVTQDQSLSPNQGGTNYLQIQTNTNVPTSVRLRLAAIPSGITSKRDLARRPYRTMQDYEKRIEQLDVIVASLAELIPQPITEDVERRRRRAEETQRPRPPLTPLPVAQLPPVSLAEIEQETRDFERAAQLFKMIRAERGDSKETTSLATTGK